MMIWLAAAYELHKDLRNDVDGLRSLFSNHRADYCHLLTSYMTMPRS